jgi:hypothetical protein
MEIKDTDKIALKQKKDITNLSSVNESEFNDKSLAELKTYFGGSGSATTLHRVTINTTTGYSASHEYRDTSAVPLTQSAYFTKYPSTVFSIISPSQGIFVCRDGSNGCILDYETGAPNALDDTIASFADTIVTE